MAELTEEQRNELKVRYAELKAMRYSLPSEDSAPVSDKLVTQYHQILSDLTTIAGEDLSEYHVTADFDYVVEGRYGKTALTLSMREALTELIMFLRTKFEITETDL
ncbi:MAG: hypothetical protein V3U74_03245 [Thermodesulfobacteriota bacterium]